MKRLILVRHAKSSWEFNLPDHERPLNQRGNKDAKLVSKQLVDDIKPDRIFSSDALRAKTTAEIFVLNLTKCHKDIILNDALYDFSGADLINVIKNCDNSINELMVFGHNNAITNFVNNYGDIFIDNVPTSGVTIIEFEIHEWNDIKKGKTVRTLFPRDLKN